MSAWQEDWALPWITPPSHSPIAHPGVLRWENWHHPSFQSLYPLWNMAGLVQPFLKVSGCGKMCSTLRGNYGFASRRLGWIGLLMKLQDQHKLHCRPKHVFPLCFGLCLSPWYVLLFFLPCWEAPGWTLLLVFRGCRCLFEVLCYLGIFRREEV